MLAIRLAVAASVAAITSFAPRTAHAQLSVLTNTVEERNAAPGERYTGTNVVLATGSYARSLPGLEIGGRIMTSDQALYLDYVPASAIVLGGARIGEYSILGAGCLIKENAVPLLPLPELSAAPLLP